MRLTLTEARKRRKFKTPEELAAHLESIGRPVHKATIYRIESGSISNPSNDTVEALELGLRLRRGTLVFGVPPVAEEAQAS